MESTGADVTQYFEQLVPMPPKYFQKTLGPTKCEPLQYLVPSFSPAIEWKEMAPNMKIEELSSFTNFK